MRIKLEHYARILGIELDPQVKAEEAALERIQRRNWEGY